MVIADLHIHGRYSQATSKDLTFETLEKWAKVKGIDLLGTGDFTHPKWIAEMKESLTEGDDGISRSKTGFPFVLQTEISQVFTQGGKGRRVHNIIFAPNLEVVSQITDYLLGIGRVDYDGRPIFKLPCDKLVEDMRQISKDIEIVPAHIWTPWFGLLGSKGGFDSFEEAFGDQIKHINAFETGLSSDPEMNWRLSQLDKFQQLSFSDLHSYWPWRMGREATVFDCAVDYKSIINAIRTGEGLKSTIEVDPNYGKYHFDGHRKCGICLSPKETLAANGKCPKCGKEVVVGVESRVEELADREVGYRPSSGKDFSRLIPLSELISLHVGKGIATKTVWKVYDELMKLGRNEIDVLMNVPLERMFSIVDEKLVHLIKLNREGKIEVKPGYDGEYGVPVLD